MRVMERGGRYKNEIDNQVAPRARKTTGLVPPTAGIDVLFETVRQKRAYATRGM
jgi:hypothetical protein